MERKNKGACLVPKTGQSPSPLIIKIANLTILDASKDLCLRDYFIDHIAAEGDCSQVYIVCKKGNPHEPDCNYAVKKTRVTDAHLAEIFQRDVYFLRQLQDKHVTPRLIDAWICGIHGYQLMDRWMGDLSEEYVEQDVAAKTCSMHRIVFDQIMHIVRTISDQKIVHADLKLDQFLYRISGKQLSIALSDFGVAFDFAELFNRPMKSERIKFGWVFANNLCPASDLLPGKDEVLEYNLWMIHHNMTNAEKSDRWVYQIYEKDGKTTGMSFPDLLTAAMDSSLTDKFRCTWRQ
jgi:hypothetical protein